MFERTRIKLTLWYLLIIMFISVMFSLVIYEVLTKEVDRFNVAQRVRIERRLREEFFTPGDDTPFKMPVSSVETQELVDEIKQRILLMLLFVNSGILIFSGGLGYFLAGKTLRPIGEMVDEQSRFVSDASHELKTPLTSLKSAFEVYLRGKNKNLKDANVLASESIVEVNKLQDLTENLLLLAKSNEVNNRVGKFKKIFLGDVIDVAYSKVRSQVETKKIKFKIKGKKLYVLGDFDSLVNLFVILFDNAIKYTNKNGIVEVMYFRDDGHIIVTVADNGMGIGEDDLVHIFDRFYRADTARSKNGTGGFGLGLAIAKKIVDNHKGAIGVKSDKYTGTIFTIKLPAKFTKIS